MKKILITVLIVLLILLAYFTIFQGISIGSFNILSVEQIINEDNNLTNKIAETNALLKKDYPTKKEALLTEVSNLLEEKEKYFNIAKVSTESELSQANTQEKYLTEYLWVRVGRHAKSKGVNIRMDITSANNGDADMQNIAFTVNGQYVGIVEFIYALEDDSELNFKIENFKMEPSDTNLVATFNVKNIRIDLEQTTATVEKQNVDNAKQNENTNNTTEGNTTSDTTDSNTVS